MRSFIVTEPLAGNVYQCDDPDGAAEIEIEAGAVRALSSAYPNYTCIVFTGGFRHDNQVKRPDLAMIAKDYSHWFVIEVELASHSFYRHVLPQVLAFRYGEPLAECSKILARELKISHEQALTLITQVPRTVAVIANRLNLTWQIALSAHQIQYGIISLFKEGETVKGIEFEGLLEALEKNLGFGRYSATDRSLRFPGQVELPDGEIQLSDPNGSRGTWIVTRDDRFAWITKKRGTADFRDGEYVQLRRTRDGFISMKAPRASSN